MRSEWSRSTRRAKRGRVRPPADGCRGGRAVFLALPLAVLLLSASGAVQAQVSGPRFLVASALARSSSGAAPVPLAEQVRQEVNAARSDPARYAAYLRGWLRHLEGKVVRAPGLPPFRLTEGAAALREAVRFLDRQKPLAGLALSDGMSLGARDLAREQGPAGGFGHIGADGSEPGDRIGRYGVWQRRAAELIQYGAADPRQIVALLIVDDAVGDRGHRRVLFDERYRALGIAFGPHRVYGRMCVLTLAVGYEEAPLLAELPEPNSLDRAAREDAPAASVRAARGAEPAAWTRGGKAAALARSAQAAASARGGDAAGFARGGEVAAFTRGAEAAASARGAVPARPAAATGGGFWAGRGRAAR